MRDRLLTIFETNPTATYATSDLVKQTHPEVYKTVQQGKNKDDQRTKAQLHRKILYHCRQLQDDGVIRVTRRTKHGEKVFTYQAHDIPSPEQRLDINFDRSHDNRSDIINAADTKDHVEITRRQNTNAVLDAVFIDASHYEPRDLTDVVTKLAPITDDCIAIHNIAQTLTAYAAETAQQVIQRCDDIAAEHACYLCLHITATNATKPLINASYDTRSSFKTVIAGDHDPSNHDTYTALLRNAQQTRRKAHIEHTDTAQRPCIIGENGPYTVPRDRAEDQPITCLAHNTAFIDTNAYLAENSITSFRDVIIAAAKHMYIATAEARSEITIALKHRFDENSRFYTDFFASTQNYIRFWNYGGSTDQYSFESFKSVIDTATQHIETMTTKQTTIFQACGIPVNADITIGPAFSTGIPQAFTTRAYTKQTLYDIAELRRDHWQDTIRQREETARMFAHADRMRIFRAPTEEPDALADETKHINDAHNIPLLCYDFSQRTKERQLHDFL